VLRHGPAVGKFRVLFAEEIEVAGALVGRVRAHSGFAADGGAHEHVLPDYGKAERLFRRRQRIADQAHVAGQLRPA
jgi:hypothetical protein